MAASTSPTVIGDLLVRLGLDPSGLTQGSAASQKAMKQLVDRAKADLAAVTKATAAVSLALVGVALAVRKFADEADQLSDAALAIGVTVERLSELRYAAMQAGSPVEAVELGIRKLGESMSRAATGQITPATEVIRGLGIAITDANGKVRSTDDVLDDIANKFETYADSANKSALATQIFGEKGKQLIPFLNQGQAGLKALSEEARKFGIVVDADTVDKAAAIKDEFDLLGDVAKSTGIRLSAEFLPAVRSLRQLFTDPKFQTAVLQLASGVGSLVKNVADFVRSMSSLSGFYQFLTGTSELQDRMALLNVEMDRLTKGKEEAFKNGAPTEEFDRKIEQTRTLLASLKDELKAMNGEEAPPLRGVVTPAPTEAPTIDVRAIAENRAYLEAEFEAIREASRRALDDIIASPWTTITEKQMAATEAVKAGVLGFQEYEAAIKSLEQYSLNEILNAPMETMEAKLNAITRAAENGAIGFQEYGAMVKSVTDQNQQQLDDLLSATSSTLTAIFKDNKAAAIASAIINTYQGVTKALSAYPPPFNFAMAAAVAAQGFAQVASIKSTNEKSSGGGTRPSASPPVATPAASNTGGGGEGGGGVQRSLYVEGVDPAMMYSGKQMQQLVEGLMEFQRDGGNIVFGKR